MFQVLGRYLRGIAPDGTTGIHGERSADNVRWLQRRAGLEETGVLDQPTWDALSRLYEVFVIPDHLSLEPELKSWG